MYVRRRWAAACLLPGRRGGGELPGAVTAGIRHLEVVVAEEVGERDANARGVVEGVWGGNGAQSYARKGLGGQAAPG